MNSKIMNSILVTGGAGYIGSNMVHLLANKFLVSNPDAKIIVLDNLCTGFEGAIHPKAIFVKGDIKDVNLVTDLIAKYQIDSVIHFAAFIRADESVEDPYKYYENNSFGTLQLLKACSNAKSTVKNFIFSSTAAVYGNGLSNGAIDENLICEPINPYGQSKFIAEKFIKDFSKINNGFKYAILRYFNVAGANLVDRLGQRTQNSTHLIKVAAETALGKRNQMMINGIDYPTWDGSCIRDFIHVLDLVEAHWCALNFLTNGGTSDVFNLGYNQETSVKQVIGCMKKVTGVDFKVIEGPRRQGDIYYSLANCNKAKKLLNWIPKHNSIDEICLSSYEWEKLNG